jgi:hypothetical protein
LLALVEYLLLSFNFGLNDLPIAVDAGFFQLGEFGMGFSKGSFLSGENLL